MVCCPIRRIQVAGQNSSKEIIALLREQEMVLSLVSCLALTPNVTLALP